MATVFANGLGISGKATNAKTIAAFPDVCFTPPENPATPPGVPVPYPSFGMASDTENGTTTVKIEGKIVNIKNQSDLSKTSGTEAGCAAKKGVITSKNTGKEYFNSWSSDVKFDGEPVIRLSDLATNNHASPTGNTPPWAHILDPNLGDAGCLKILADVGIKVHPYNKRKKNCRKGQQSDHILQNAAFQNSRGGASISTVKKYNIKKAPCICLNDATKLTTEHGKKTAAQKALAEKHRKLGRNPTYEEVREGNLDAVKKAKAPKLNDGADGEDHPAIKCLRAICDAYFKGLMAGDDDAAKESTQCRAPDSGKFRQKQTAGVATV